MDEREENFLKDLAWSEVWFPWKKKGILIRKQESNFWEVFAVIVSVAALVVSAWASIGTWRQVDLMRAQLTAADHNGINIKIGTALYEACGKIGAGPVKAFRYVRHGQPPEKGYMLPVIGGKEREVTTQEREDYGVAMDDISNSIEVLFMQASMFNSIESLKTFSAVKNVVQLHLNAAQDVVADYNAPHLDLEKIMRIGVDCSAATQQVVIQAAGAISAADLMHKIDPAGKMPELHTPN
jgi:hypothetical protein